MILQQILEGIYLLKSELTPPPGWQTTNLYLLGFKNLVLIDTGYQDPGLVKFLKDFLEQNSARLEKILLTHGHLDHTSNLKQIKSELEPEIIAHIKAKPPLEQRGRAEQIDQWIEEEKSLESELGKIQILHTPGHSPGHISLYLESLGVLFTGDLVVGEGTSLVGPPEGDMQEYLNSLERVKKLELKIILPGHGPIITEPYQHLNNLIEHRQLREVQILKLLQQAPLTAQELVEKIYVGMIHPALHRAAKITVLGHLSKLEQEGKVKAEPGEKEPNYQLLVSLPF